METFIVRLWSPGDVAGLDREHVCGVVEHVGGERRQTFASPDVLIAFLRDSVVRTPRRVTVRTADGAS